MVMSMSPSFRDGGVPLRRVAPVEGDRFLTRPDPGRAADAPSPLPHLPEALGVDDALLHARGRPPHVVPKRVRRRTVGDPRLPDEAIGPKRRISSNRSLRGCALPNTSHAWSTFANSESHRACTSPAH